MAETLTMESNVEKTSIDSLSAEEQDSLKVGEQMQEAQDNLLAGKYKSAQELEQGYLELQKKLGQTEQTEEAPEATEEQPEEEQPEELTEEQMRQMYEQMNKGNILNFDATRGDELLKGIKDKFWQQGY